MNSEKKGKKASLDVQTCSNCGNPILLGDEICSLCGKNVVSWKDRFRQQPPNIVVLVGFAVGVMFALAATGMENPWRIVALVIAVGSIASGGVFYAVHLLITSDTRREKLGKSKDKKGGWWNG